MATYEDFQQAQDDGKVHEFSPRTSTGRVLRGKVTGRAATVLSRAGGLTTRAWKIQDENGTTFEVACEDYDID